MSESFPQIDPLWIAVGILMSRDRTELDEAFHAITCSASHLSVPVSDVVAYVLVAQCLPT